MKLALLGVGNAGTRLVDALLAVGTESTRPFTADNVVAFNTTPAAFAETDQLADKRQVVVGDTHPEVVQPADPDDENGDSDNGVDEADESEESDDRREGVAGDPELGVEAARDDLPEIRRALDMIDDTEVDAAMIVGGLGGGTGCGVGGVLLEELKAIYEIPVYVLGVLPTDDESDRRAWTAARAVRTFVPLADAVFPVDNETWLAASGDEEYDAVNREIATRVVSLFGAGERETAALSELRMDPNDLRRTLAVGGLATVGYAETQLDDVSEGWFTRLRRLLGFDVPAPEPQTDAVTIKQLVKRAVGSKLTLPCDVETADRVLLVLSGPPKELSRKGFETGRYLLEEETGTVEILAGDEPLPEADRITATLLLSNVTGVPRIETLQERAVDYQREHGLSIAADDGDEQPAADQSGNNDRLETDHGFDFQDDELIEGGTDTETGMDDQEGADDVDDDDDADGETINADREMIDPGSEVIDADDDDSSGDETVDAETEATEDNPETEPQEQ